tara:strand:- start:192 stop:1298 length:1107 start_codon:yes stop_codon:yes gene_type:complete
MQQRNRDKLFEQKLEEYAKRRSLNLSATSIIEEVEKMMGDNLSLVTEMLIERKLHFEYIGNGNTVRVKHDDREIIMEEMKAALEPHGFSHNMIQGGSLGRLENKDRVGGSTFVVFKPESPRAAEVGEKFESDLADLMTRIFGDSGITTTTAGFGHGSDLTLSGPKNKLTFEIKKNLGKTDWGQFRVRYDTNVGEWEPSPTKKYLENADLYSRSFEEVSAFLNQNCKFPNFDGPYVIKNGKIVGLRSSEVTGEVKDRLQSDWFGSKTDVKIPFDFERIIEYYANKGDMFIQVGLHGLYTTTEAASKVYGVPYFGDAGLNGFLRIRIKPNSGRNNSHSFVIAHRLAGKLEPSPISLTRPETLGNIMNTII